MNNYNFTVLLQKLGNSLRRWAENAPFDRDGSESARSAFNSPVGRHRREVIVALAADRRDYLAALLDTALEGLVEAGEELVAICSEAKKPAGVQFWQDFGLDNIPFSLDSNTVLLSKAWFKLMNCHRNCDLLLSSIDKAIQRVDLPNGKRKRTYKRQQLRRSYLPMEIRQQLRISAPSLNKYAKAAGISSPNRGGRNYRYSEHDVDSICRYIREHVSEKKIVEAANQYLMRNKN